MPASPALPYSLRAAASIPEFMADDECEPSKLNFDNPPRTSGAFMNRVHRRPLRWFSIARRGQVKVIAEVPKTLTNHSLLEIEEVLRVA